MILVRQGHCEMKDPKAKCEVGLYTADARCGIGDIRGPALGLLRDGWVAGEYCLPSMPTPLLMSWEEGTPKFAGRRAGAHLIKMAARNLVGLDLSASYLVPLRLELEGL